MKVNPWAPPLTLLAIAVLVVLTWNIPDSFALLLAAVSAGVALMGAVQSVTRGLRPVAAAFYIFWFSWMGVGPIAQLTIGQVAWGDTSVLSHRPAVYGALLLGVLAIGAFWVGGQVAQARKHKPLRAAPGRIRGWVILVLAAMLLAVAPLAFRIFGLSTYFSSRNERSQVLRETGNTLDALGGPQFALFTALPIALGVAITLLSLYQMQLAWRGFRAINVVHLTTLLFGLAAITVFANPLSQTRFIALTAFGSLIIAVLRPTSTRAGLVFLTVGIIGTIVVYPLANYFRGASARDALDLTAQTFTSVDFDGFQQVMNTINYVDAHGFTWGLQLASAALFFVPRALWTGKADPASIDIASDAGYLFTNLSLPVHAELYLQFGAVGVGIGMFGLGFFASRADTAWLERPFSKFAMFVPYLTMVMFGILRGPFGAQVPIYMPVLIILAFAITTKAARSTSVAPPPYLSTSALGWREARH